MLCRRYMQSVWLCIQPVTVQGMSTAGRTELRPAKVTAYVLDCLKSQIVSNVITFITFGGSFVLIAVCLSVCKQDK